jgi:hypothetical protein
MDNCSFVRLSVRIIMPVINISCNILLAFRNMSVCRQSMDPARLLFTSMTQLPTSVYRLLLRTCSAAVLHHRRSCLNLRKRWRPTFDAAARVTKALQQAPSDATDTWRAEREKWLRTWNARSTRMSFSCFPGIKSIICLRSQLIPHSTFCTTAP